MEPRDRPLPDSPRPRAAQRTGMTPPVQYYDDGLVQLDREALTLRRYHFPSGTSKVIPLRTIRGHRAKPLGLLMSRFRLWGPPALMRWVPLEWLGPLKPPFITLQVRGTRARPPSTP